MAQKKSIKAMLKPITIGDKTFHNNIIQGPLAGVSAAPFRRLTYQYGDPAYTVTEMMSANTIIKSNSCNKRYRFKDPDEGDVAFQLSGTEPTEMLRASREAERLGATLIDLNCGCPVKKIRQKGAGSKLLSNPEQLYRLIATIKAEITIPLTVKIRVQGFHQDPFHDKLVEIFEKAKPDAVIVHGRNWRDDYTVPCQYQDIRFFVENLSCPVIGNGDIKDLQTLKTMFATGCDGVMIARAGVGQPWLIKKLQAEWHGLPFQQPSASMLLLEHVHGLIELLQSERKALQETRQFAKYYARHQPWQMAFHNEVIKCDHFANFEKLVTRYF